MNDQQIYNIAEWLVYNADAVNILIGETDDKEILESRIMYKVAEHFRQVTPEELEIVFQDERVKIILHKYYLKGYEH